MPWHDYAPVFFNEAWSRATEMIIHQAMEEGKSTAQETGIIA
jgi:hypothetical protein